VDVSVGAGGRAVRVVATAKAESLGTGLRYWRILVSVGGRRHSVIVMIKPQRKVTISRRRQRKV
jgi:hypothetical protein